MSVADLEKNKISVEVNDASVSADTSSAEETPKEIVDPNIIDFDGPNDPENPFNWSPRYK